MAGTSGITPIANSQVAQALKSLANEMKGTQDIHEQKTANMVRPSFQENIGVQKMKVVTAADPNIGGNIDVST
jgi:hypothetical protein